MQDALPRFVLDLSVFENPAQPDYIPHIDDDPRRPVGKIETQRRPEGNAPFGLIDSHRALFAGAFRSIRKGGYTGDPEGRSVSSERIES